MHDFYLGKLWTSTSGVLTFQRIEWALLKLTKSEVTTKYLLVETIMTLLSIIYASQNLDREDSFMGRLTRYTILFALSLSCASFCLPSNAQTKVQSKVTKKPTGSVAGRVTVKGKGKGGIVVSVRLTEISPQMGPLRKAMTDADGNYRITDVPAGNYQIMPVAPAFVGTDFNSPARQGKSLILSEGENVDSIDFSMIRGGVITGRVSTADGRPVIEERITLTLANQPEGPGVSPGVSQMATNVQTDDRGIYRIFGLAAGRYKVSVGQAPDSFPGGIGPGRPVYERVYHPDVTDPNEARVVELGEGSEVANVDITVGESKKGFAVAGVLIDSETNQQLPNVRIGLRRIVANRDVGFFGTSAQTDRLGTFRFENLSPGRYAVVSVPQPNSDLQVNAVEFEVVDQDIAGLTLRTSRGASVSGFVVLEGTNDKTVQSKLAQVLILAFVRGEVTSSGFAQSSTIRPDGSFRVGGLQPGTAQLQLSAQDRRLLTGFVISRIEREGVVLPRGFEIKSGEQILGVKVVVIYGSGIVRGTIKIENGPLPTGARVMVRLTKPETPGVMVGRSQEADARGRFALEGVPAGSYDLWVSVFIPGSRLRQPSTKQSVSVTEGSVVEVEPVIDLEANQPPRP